VAHALAAEAREGRLRRVRGIPAAALTVLFAALAATPPAQAGEESCRGGVRSFYLENDLFYRTDRNYTSGIKLAWASPDLKDFTSEKCLPDLLKPVEEGIRRLLALDDAAGALSRNVVATVGQEIYTPGDRTRTDVIRDDRPYAGWLYLGLGYNRRFRAHDPWTEWLDSFELRLGMVGPASLARFSQNLVHDARGFPRFLGWDNQLRNEPGAQVIGERKYKMPTRAGDLIVHFGGSAGNVATYLNSGVEVRLGSGIPDDFGSSPLRPAGNNTAPGSFPAANRGLHAFAALDARAVARDIFLDGNTFVDSHRVHKRPFVADLALGVAGFAGGWKFSYARVFRSQEFEGQASRHSYGSFTISHAFD
jgi:lipid A 3-O-deacylase